jgi:fructose-bisphosphate aldolase class II
VEASLADILPGANAEHSAVAAFNIFGLDEAVCVATAAEALRRPVILMTNKDVVRRIPVEVFGPALRAVAQSVSVPVVVHLDHTYTFETIYRAIRAGYTSVMFDGSQLPYEENVAGTQHVVEIAHACGVSVEGEIGSVAYNEAETTIRHELTDPETAARFCSYTGVDAVAVSVGTVHKLTDKSAAVDQELLHRIAAATPVPLVIHGSSGVPDDDLIAMARGPVAKFNIGTALRRAWGETLRMEFAAHPEEFDHLTLTKAPLEALRRTAREMIALLAADATDPFTQKENNS